MPAALLKTVSNTGVCEIFKNIYFENYIRTTASESLSGTAILTFNFDIPEVALCQRSYKMSVYAGVPFQ